VRILLVSPHVDDAEIMNGGSMQKWVEEGAELYYVAFSDAKISNEGYDTKVECWNALQKIVGLDRINAQILDYPTRGFYERESSISEHLYKLKKEIHPDVVVAPGLEDVHRDHHVVARAVLSIFKGREKVLLYKEPWNCFGVMRLNYFVALTEEEVDVKIEAINCYESQRQKKRPYFNNDYLKAMAVSYGGMCGGDFAEAYEVVKMVEG
jgi:LmbE family N-acetylglucosaminyl deacetylase